MAESKSSRRALTGFLKPGRSNPNTVRVWLDVPRKIYRRAERLTGAYTLLSMGKVLEGWIEDAAHGASHLDSWEHRQLTKWLRGHPFPKNLRPGLRNRKRCQPEIA